MQKRFIFDKNLDLERKDEIPMRDSVLSCIKTRNFQQMDNEPIINL